MPALRYLLACCLLIAVTYPAHASPTDDVLRLAPPDAALVFVLQKSRDTLDRLGDSPFVKWFPSTTLGKQLLVDGGTAKSLLATRDGVLRDLGIKPEELADDILGDAVVFAFTPGPPDDPKAERGVLLIRPRKMELLVKLIDRLTGGPAADGAKTGVFRREHRECEFFESRKAGEPADYFVYRGGVFAFSRSANDIRELIERDLAPKPNLELSARIARLELDATLIVLVNPRAFDAEVNAQIPRAKPEDREFSTRFAAGWPALEDAAFYVAIDSGAECGIALRFDKDKLPIALKGWILGPKLPSPLWESIPDRALAAIAGRTSAQDVIAALESISPLKGNAPVREAIDSSLNPVFGKDKLPLVLDALGPDWAMWIEAPASPKSPFPTFTTAIRFRDEGAKGKAALASLRDAMSFGFQMARFAYNSNHADQLEIAESTEEGYTIKSLVGETALPHGVRPSYAFKGGYLLLSTSPDSIRVFRPPVATHPARAEITHVRISGSATRAYLQTHKGVLAKTLASYGIGAEAELISHFERAVVILEVVERVEIVSRSNDNATRLSVRMTLSKQLK